MSISYINKRIYLHYGMSWLDFKNAFQRVGISIQPLDPGISDSDMQIEYQVLDCIYTKDSQKTPTTGKAQVMRLNYAIEALQDVVAKGYQITSIPNSSIYKSSYSVLSQNDIFIGNVDWIQVKGVEIQMNPATQSKYEYYNDKTGHFEPFINGITNRAAREVKKDIQRNIKPTRFFYSGIDVTGYNYILMQERHYGFNMDALLYSFKSSTDKETLYQITDPAAAVKNDKKWGCVPYDYVTLFDSVSGFNSRNEYCYMKYDPESNHFIVEIGETGKTEKIYTYPCTDKSKIFIFKQGRGWWHRKGDTVNSTFTLINNYQGKFKTGHYVYDVNFPTTIASSDASHSALYNSTDFLNFTELNGLPVNDPSLYVLQDYIDKYTKTFKYDFPYRSEDLAVWIRDWSARQPIQISDYSYQTNDDYSLTINFNDIYLPKRSADKFIENLSNNIEVNPSCVFIKEHGVESLVPWEDGSINPIYNLGVSGKHNHSIQAYKPPEPNFEICYINNNAVKLHCVPPYNTTYKWALPFDHDGAYSNIKELTIGSNKYAYWDPENTVIKIGEIKLNGISETWYNNTGLYAQDMYPGYAVFLKF